MDIDKCPTINMRLIDKRSNCNIYNKFFIDDLDEYTLSEDNSLLSINYHKNSSNNIGSYLSAIETKSTQSDLSKISIDSESLKNTIEYGYRSKNFGDSWLLDSDSDTDDNTWRPIIIDSFSSKIDTKLLGRGGSIKRRRLGIENFMSFSPSFKSWDISPNDIKLGIDWIINSPYVTFFPQYGVLGWIKSEKKYDPGTATVIDSIRSGDPSNFFTLDKFPKYSRVRSGVKISNSIDDEFIKLDDNTLLIINEYTNKFNNIEEVAKEPNIYFNYQTNIINLSNNEAVFTLSYPDSKYFELFGYKYSNFLWISNGEFYSYVDNNRNSSYEISKSYLSPCLYNKYRQIYHILTLDHKKNLSYGMNLNQNRLLKKICYLLATSPLIDGVGSHALLDSDILNIINTYLNYNTQLLSTYDIYPEIKLLVNTVVSIFKKLQNLDITSHKTLGDNYITNKSILFKKLLNKYGASLKINKDTILTYKKSLTYGDTIFINQPIESRCDKNLINSTVFNNQTIRLNQAVISTDIKEDSSNIKLGSKTVLPLADIAKNPDLEISFNIGDDEIHQYSDNLSFDINAIDNFDTRVSYRWECISGPCMRFLDFNKDPSRQIRFTYSTDSSPTAFVYSTGRYVVQAYLTADAGSVQDTKTIYIVNDKNEYSPGSIIEDKDLIIRKNPIRIQSDNLKIMCPNLSQIGIHKRGLFWPLKTDSYISKLGTLYSAPGQDFGIFRLEGNEKFVFEVDKTKISSNNSTLKLSYYPNNTTMVLDRIILENMRDDNEDCSQCKSFYKDLLVQDSPTYSRRLRSPDSISLYKYQWNSSKKLAEQVGSISFEYPKISTKYAPKIKSFGGWMPSTIDNFSNGTIPFQDMLGTLPPITGHLLNYPTNIKNEPYHLCFPKESNVLGQPVFFKKGVFHPASGWISKFNIPADEVRLKNKSSVLKFNPGARETFRFSGAGFFNMKSSFTILDDGFDTVVSSPNFYKSSITLDINPKIIFDLAPDGAGAADVAKTNDSNQQKELEDSVTYYGFRSLNEGIYDTNKDLVDEFGIEISTDNKTLPFCDNSIDTKYSFCSLGPKSIQSNKPVAGQLKLQSNAVEGLSIQDIEVKLNFLNYVNTKNLVVWLDVDLCEAEVTRTNPADISPIKIVREFNDDKFLDSNNLFPGVNKGLSENGIDTIYKNRVGQNNSKVVDYLKDLTLMNTVLDESGNSNKNKLRLFLLNKEHVENNSYNFSLTFSDHAPKQNKLFDHNITTNSGVLENQQILQHSVYCQPTVSASGYSDKECILYGNIIRNNNLNILNNSFAKFKNLKLFSGNKISNSKTTFTLNIGVIDENDDMRIYDNLKNNDLLTNFKSNISKATSNTIYSSLCNWELILHTSTGHKFIDKDSLGLIKYGSEPNMPGYNFIADLSIVNNSTSADITKLPPVNLNAPNNYQNNLNLCRYKEYELNSSIKTFPIEFPSHAVLQILINQGVMATTGSILGTLIGDTTLQYAEIFKMLFDIRRQLETDKINQNLDRAIYDNYSFGDASKILLNVSKEGVFWYTLEASIFKYSNSSVLQNNRYKFIRLNSNNVPALSEFSYAVVNGISDLVDDNSNIKTVDELYNNLELLQKNNILGINKKDILGQFENKTLILIKGKRAHHFFSRGDQTFPVKASYYADSSSKLETVISDTGIIFKNNQYYTLLSLAENKNVSHNKISIPDSNILLVYKDEISSDDKPFNPWGLEKDSLSKKTPEQIHSFFGVGSYGDGSTLVDKNILSYTQTENKLENIYNILNNHENNRLKNNIVTVFLKNSSGQITTKTTKTLISGYSYNIDELKEIFQKDNYLLKNIDNTIDSKLQKLIKQLLYSTADNSDDKYSIIDVKSSDFNDEFFTAYNVVVNQALASPNNSSTSGQSIICNSGELILENDYIEKKILNNLTQNEIDVVTERLFEVLLKPNTDLVDQIGDETKTETIINTGSISDIESHYNKLSMDPAPCFSKNSSPGNCWKKKTKQALSDRYIEKHRLTKLLEEFSQRDINNSNIAYIEIPGNTILPQIKQSLDYSNSPLLTKYKEIFIKYSYPDYYWINIDPKQQCFLDQKETVKVFKKTTVECGTIGGTSTIIDLEADHICPVKVNSSGLSDGYVYFSNEGSKFTYERPLMDSGYISLKLEIEKEIYKKGYEDSWEWKDIDIVKTFFINANGPRDTLVTSTETYETPIPRVAGYGSIVPLDDYSNIKNRVYSIFNLDDVDSIQVRFKNIPRKLKGVDPIYDRYAPNKDGDLSKTLVPSPGGPVNNNLAFWNCVDKKTLKLIEPPPYLKVQNEMIFRAFFNSTDLIEHKDIVMESLYPWEWIPYEYDFD